MTWQNIYIYIWQDPIQALHTSCGAMTTKQTTDKKVRLQLYLQVGSQRLPRTEKHTQPTWRSGSNMIHAHFPRWLQSLDCNCILRTQACTFLPGYIILCLGLWATAKQVQVTIQIEQNSAWKTCGSGTELLAGTNNVPKKECASLSSMIHIQSRDCSQRGKWAMIHIQSRDCTQRGKWACITSASLKDQVSTWVSRTGFRSGWMRPGSEIYLKDLARPSTSTQSRPSGL